MRQIRMMVWFVVATVLTGLLPTVATSEEKGFDYRHPRPVGNVEEGVSGTKKVNFFRPQETAGVLYDMRVHFPGDEVQPLQVESVEVNDVETRSFLVSNSGTINLNHRTHGHEDVAVSLFSGWEPGKEYKVRVVGHTPTGELVTLAASDIAPEKQDPVPSLGFAGPSPEHPYHHATLTLASEYIEPGTVTKVEVDGKWNRDPRFFNVGIQHPRDKGKCESLEGETYTGRIDGTRDFKVVIPCNWTNGSEHSVKVTVQYDSGSEAVFENDATAPGSGGYWSSDWPHFVSLTLRETAGVLRQGEPVHAMLGLFSDHLTNPTREIRVVTHDPHSPKATSEGWVVAPSQVTSTVEWRDSKVMAIEEKDAETGEKVHRYDPTFTVELVFLADVQPYEEKVYYVVYGNPNAEDPACESDLSVQDTTGIGQTVKTAHYEIGLATNSGAIETVTILGEGDPVLLEHRLETNGAVHWNPGCYAPPIPWVHASDWEGPEFSQISGPIMHRTRRYADLPHMKTVDANVSYSFYAGQPYILHSSVMRVKEDIFVMALRNGEIVLNHAVLDEFVWYDPSGVVKSLPIEGTRKHPIHALEVPPDTSWMAFISRKDKVGFASIQLEYANTNLYGDPACEAQPYIYVQNGPWIYWSRGLVYPFGGMNFSRMMRVRAGSLHLEKNAWLPFRFSEGDNPFEGVEEVQKKLTNPLLVHEWMGTDPRTPEKWVMPILTMPFDEGVSGAVSGHKKVDE